MPRVPILPFEEHVKLLWQFRVPQRRGSQLVSAKDMTPDLWAKHLAFEEQAAKQEVEAAKQAAEAKIQQVRQRATQTQDLLAAFALGLTGDAVMAYRRPPAGIPVTVEHKERVVQAHVTVSQEPPRTVDVVVTHAPRQDKAYKATVKRSDA